MMRGKFRWAAAFSALAAWVYPVIASAQEQGHHVHESAAGSWFTNYGNYMPRMHCLRLADGAPDSFWSWLLIGTTVAIIVAYLRIYKFLFDCYRSEEPQFRNKKLMQLANLFFACAVCGYVMSIVMFFWPAYRLLAFLLVGLTLFAWQFTWGMDRLKVTFAAVRLARQNETQLEQLQVQSQEMKQVLENVGQGFLTVDQSGKPSAHRSAKIDAWLGSPVGDETIWEWIAKTDADFAEWFELSWDDLVEDIMPIEVCLDQLPSRMVVDERLLEFEYRPIHDQEGAFEGILVVASDVTEQVRQAQIAGQQQEILELFERISKDRNGFVEFRAEAARLIEQIEACPEEDLVRTKRDLHTLKGNTGIFGLRTLSRTCHEIESKLEEGDESWTEDIADLRVQWDSAMGQVAVFFSEEKENAIELSETDYQQLLLGLRGSSRRDIARMVASWKQEPTKKRLNRIADQARRLAEKLEKGEIVVDIDHNDLRISSNRWKEFWVALNHVVRNAVDHGLEGTEERIQSGKEESGKLSLRTYIDADLFVVEIGDDGRGIDWQAIKAKAQENGLPAETHKDLVQALFADGVSTRDEVNEYSGRGVGMAAAKEACLAIGGEVDVETTEGRGTTFLFKFPLSSTRDESLHPGLASVMSSGAFHARM